MIEFTKSFKVGDKVFATLQQAQRHELELLLGRTEDGKMAILAIPEWIFNNKDAILDILTTTVSSRPKARAAHGGRKQRKIAALPAQP